MLLCNFDIFRRSWFRVLDVIDDSKNHVLVNPRRAILCIVKLPERQKSLQYMKVVYHDLNGDVSKKCHFHSPGKMNVDLSIYCHLCVIFLFYFPRPVNEKNLK